MSQVARHFQSVDPRYSQVSLGADYTMESHCRDHECYAAVTRGRRRRAKALLDFERHDDDELGFRKNDVITGEGRRCRATMRKRHGYFIGCYPQQFGSG